MEAVNAFNQEVGAAESGGRGGRGWESGPEERGGAGRVTVAAIAVPQAVLGFRLWAARARCGASRGLCWGGPGQRLSWPGPRPPARMRGKG